MWIWTSGYLPPGVTEHLLAAPSDAADRPEGDGTTGHAYALSGGGGEGVPGNGRPARLRQRRAAAERSQLAQVDALLPEDAVRPSVRLGAEAPLATRGDVRPR